MIFSRKPLLFTLTPVLFLAFASLVLWRDYRREQVREMAVPGFGIRVASIRQASAESQEAPVWRETGRILPDPRSQLAHAKKLSREVRVDPSLCDAIEQELSSVISRAPQSAEAEEALHLKARIVGLWGSRRNEESVALFEEFLRTYPESDRRGKVFYELGLTHEVGLEDPDRGATYYRKSIAVSPDSLTGLLASKKIEEPQ